MKQKNYSDIEDFDFGVALPEAPTASPFQGWGAVKFEKWLEAGLKRYLWEGMGAWAFPGAEDKLAAHGMLVDGLQAVYRGLDGTLQGEFKEAVANLLASMPPDTRSIPMFSNLLSLASSLPAPEVLRLLPKRIGNGYFGFARNPDSEGLFDTALLTVARLAAPRREALDCLHDLISSPAFDAAYAGIALIALCQSDHTHFDRHMKLMRPYLQAMFTKYGKGISAKRTWAARVLDVMSLNRLAAALPKLKYFDTASESAPLDTWLLDGLFSGKKPLLKCAKNKKGILRLSRPGSPETDWEIPLVGKHVGDMLNFLNEYGYIDQGKAKLEIDQVGMTYIQIQPFLGGKQNSRISIRGMEGERVQKIDQAVAKSFGMEISRPDNPRRSAGNEAVSAWQGG